MRGFEGQPEPGDEQKSQRDACGALETVVEGRTGVFFDQQSVPALKAAVDDFESRTWDAAACRQNAERFSTAQFRENFEAFVEEQWSGFSSPATERAARQALTMRDWLEPLPAGA